jgi:hypothetical protein
MPPRPGPAVTHGSRPAPGPARDAPLAPGCLWSVRRSLNAPEGSWRAFGVTAYPGPGSIRPLMPRPKSSSSSSPTDAGSGARFPGTTCRSSWTVLLFTPVTAAMARCETRSSPRPKPRAARFPVGIVGYSVVLSSRSSATRTDPHPPHSKRSGPVWKRTWSWQMGHSIGSVVMAPTIPPEGRKVLYPVTSNTPWQ